MAVSIALGLVSGLVATLVMTVLMMPMMKKGPGVAQFIAARIRGGDPTAKASMMGGMVLHLLYGTIMGGIYALGSTTLNVVVVNHFLSGLLFGVLLFIISAVFVMPVSKGPVREMPKSMMVVFLALHLVYGLVLGATVTTFVATL